MGEFKKQFGTDCFDKAGDLEICPADSAIIVAILSAGTVIGALLAAPAGDSIGRRHTLMISVGIFCIGAICQVCAQATPLMLVGRWVKRFMLWVLRWDADVTFQECWRVSASAQYQSSSHYINQKWRPNGYEARSYAPTSSRSL